MSASKANIPVFIENRYNNTVLSVRFRRTVMSYIKLAVANMIIIAISGKNTRNGAKYVPVRRISIMNLRVSRIGLIFDLPTLAR